MAKKSAAALSVVRDSPALGGLPEAPADLSPAERALWDGIVETKPADWWGADSLPVLKEYVRAATTCDLLAAHVTKALAGDDADLVQMMLNMRDKEARRAATLATKLRLTQQSRYTPQSAGTTNRRAVGKRPWQV